MRSLRGGLTLPLCHTHLNNWGRYNNNHVDVKERTRYDYLSEMVNTGNFVEADYLEMAQKHKHFFDLSEQWVEEEISLYKTLNT